jgi:hypothetical protein
MYVCSNHQAQGATIMAATKSKNKMPHANDKKIFTSEEKRASLSSKTFRGLRSGSAWNRPPDIHAMWNF